MGEIEYLLLLVLHTRYFKKKFSIDLCLGLKQIHDTVADDKMMGSDSVMSWLYEALSPRVKTQEENNKGQPTDDQTRL